MLLKRKAMLINSHLIQIIWFHTAPGVLDGNLKAHRRADSRRRHVDGLDELGNGGWSNQCRVEVVVDLERPLCCQLHQ